VEQMFVRCMSHPLVTCISRLDTLRCTSCLY
jgi:hypothetical protein